MQCDLRGDENDRFGASRAVVTQQMGVQLATEQVRTGGGGGY